MTSFERLVAVMIKPWVVVSCVALIVISFLYFDQPIAYYFYSVDMRTNLPLLTWITHLGVGGVYFALLLMFALYFRYINKNPYWESRVWFLWLCVVVPSIICFGLKVMFGRARPGLLFDEHLYGFFGMQLHAPYWSFPSGHTTTVMGLMFGLAALFPNYCYRFILLGFVIVSSRILLTHHYLSDVLLACYLALLEVGLLHCWIQRKAWFNSPNGQVV